MQNIRYLISTSDEILIANTSRQLVINIGITLARRYELNKNDLDAQMSIEHCNNI